jgi:hypothetical protein
MDSYIPKTVAVVEAMSTDELYYYLNRRVVVGVTHYHCNNNIQ